MLTFLYLAFQIVFIVQSIRQEEKAGVWSWSKCVFILGFILLELILLLVPFYVVPPRSPYFTRLLVACCVLDALNFIWLILICRRWPLPDGRSPLQTHPEEQAER